MVITKYILILLSLFFVCLFVFGGYHKVCNCLFCEGDGDAISTRNVGKSKVMYVRNIVPLGLDFSHQEEHEMQSVQP